MDKQWMWGLCAPVAILAAACGAAGESTDAGELAAEAHKEGETIAPEGFVKDDGGIPAEAGGEPVAETTGAVDNTYAVGVIPTDGHTCYNSADLVTIYMDDEDDRNQSYRSYFRPLQDPRPPVGYTNWTGTNMAFCKVDGKSFKSLTDTNLGKSKFYAVLKLGQYCPNGSAEFTRYFDNEDDNNKNSKSGPLSPNVVDRNTSLKFCFFGANGTVMSRFPNLGIPYMVFHDYDGEQPATLFANKGWIYSDDEDDANVNSMSPTSGSYYTDFTRIISNGGNTMMDVAQVR